MSDTKRLNAALLGQLPANVAVPGYDRAAITTGIVHVGLGNFHRAHQALYLDEVFNRHPGNDWGICGVGLLPQDIRMAEALKPQDYLYTLVERDSNTNSARIIGCVRDYLHAPSNPQAVLSRMTDPSTRIVSLTVTEGGYYLDQGSGELEQDHPNLRHDLEHPDEAPISVYGYLTEALARIRKAGTTPFTVQSCDNLQSNGHVIQKMLTTFARLRDPELGSWIERNVAFPNSMVDRITPATTDQLRADVKEMLGGVEDAWPVMGETFRQWVIEDHFGNGRPPYEEVGAQMTSDVLPFELMKIHMLNASHQAFCHLGVLLGYETSDQAMADPQIVQLLNRYMNTVRPLINEPPGENLLKYQNTLLERFGNPAIKDQLARIAFDASSRIPKFVLPMARAQLEKGEPVDIFAFVVACWIRYLGGQDDAGKPIQVQDPLSDLLLSKVSYGDKDPTPFISLKALFGEELPQSSAFVEAVKTALASLYDNGARATLGRYCQG